MYGFKGMSVKWRLSWYDVAVGGLVDGVHCPARKCRLLPTASRPVADANGHFSMAKNGVAENAALPLRPKVIPAPAAVPPKVPQVGVGFVLGGWLIVAKLGRPG